MPPEPTQNDSPNSTQTAEERIAAALNKLNNAEKNDQVKAALEQGIAQFERGRYRNAIASFKTALENANPIGSRGGEIQLWLVNAYIAIGAEADGLALCRKLITHPDLETKRQSKRLLYILEAPELEMKPEWTTKIPDLANIEDEDRRQYTQRPKKKRRKPKPKPEPDPIDLSQVNTADNQFVWLALIGGIIVLFGLIWVS